MKLIVAVDNNWAIGSKGDLLVSIPADKKFFRFETMYKTVIMGRKTLESFPSGKPLPDRRNIVISRNPNFKEGNCEVVHSIEEALELVRDTDPEQVYVIGGGQIYEQMLDMCDFAYVTKVDYNYEADTYFPNLDENPEWELVEESEEQTYYDLIYTFCKYRKVK